MTSIQGLTSALTMARRPAPSPPPASPPAAQKGISPASLTASRPRVVPGASNATALTAPGQSTPARSAPPTNNVMGDVNGDGVVNMDDGKSLLQYLFGGGDEPQGLANGDVNGDGSVNITDAVTLYQLLASQVRPQPLAASVPGPESLTTAPTVKPNPALAVSLYTK